MNMHIQHEDDGRLGRFFINDAGKDMAEMVYNWRGPAHIVILHTEVDESLGGKGVGKELVAAGVAFAREKGIHIVPVCAFAKAIIERKQEYADVLG